eukprot:1376661-Pleurochrysis_carterae.AAC.1
MPVVAFAPPARRPLITPLFMSFRSRALRIGGLPAGFLPTLLFTSHCECVCSAWVGLELAPHIADLGVAQHAARRTVRENEVAYARVERQFDVKQC